MAVNEDGLFMFYSKSLDGAFKKIVIQQWTNILEFDLYLKLKNDYKFQMLSDNYSEYVTLMVLVVSKFVVHLVKLQTQYFVNSRQLKVGMKIRFGNHEHREGLILAQIVKLNRVCAKVKILERRWTYEPGVGE